MMMCFECGQPITDEIVWLIESDRDQEWPFHRTCADQPWPLSESRVEPVKTEG